MSRSITRKTKMFERIILRTTPEDITNFKLAAQKKGIDCSAFVKGIPIKEGAMEAI
mgnify:CR=1 FL=1